MKPVPAILLITGTCIASCSSPQEKHTNLALQQVVVPAKETVSVKGTSLRITNGGCGLQWINTSDGNSYEKAYCDIKINYGDSSMRMDSDEGAIYLDDLEIHIDRMNPWGREEDSVPAGAVRLAVLRNPAFPFLEKYGKKPVKVLSQTSIVFTDTLLERPWQEYVAVSKRLDIPLDKCKGGRYTLLRIQLKPQSNVLLPERAEVVVDDGEVITGWFSGPGKPLVPLNMGGAR